MEKYRDEVRKLMISVNVVDGAYALYAKRLGIKENALSLLYALDDGQSHSQKEICEQWLIPRTTMNTVVKECVAAGYIVLDGSSHSKEKAICITEKGRMFAENVLNQLYDLEHRAMEKTLSSFSPEFVQAVGQFADCLKEETKHFGE